MSDAGNPQNPPGVSSGSPDGTAPPVPAPPAPTARDTGGAGAPRRVPAAVQRAAKLADEMQAQMIAEMEAAAAAEQQQPPPPQEYEREAAPQQPPAPAPGTQEADTWERRYRTLQGKYDSEMPQLRGQINQMEQLIASMQSAPPAVAPSRSPSPPVEVEIPEEDYTTYGPDFVDSTRRWARAEVQRDLERQQQQIDELRNHAAASTGDRVKDRVRQAMDRDPELAGRWEALDTDPGFNQWLQELDPFSGNRRLDMLRHAYSSGDAVRTARFFKAYIQEHTDYTPSPAGSVPQTSNYLTPSNGGGGNGAGMDLTVYAAPGRVSNATPGPGAPDRRIWTTREIQAFYDGRLKGRFRGRDQEADRMERDILSAAAEGRIRNA